MNTIPKMKEGCETEKSVISLSETEITDDQDDMLRQKPISQSVTIFFCKVGVKS